MTQMDYEYTAQIDGRDADGRGRCRPSALLGHLQQAASASAEQCGGGRQVLMERLGGVWMLVRMRYELNRPLRYGSRLTVLTRHRGGRGASLYRDFDLYVDGERLGRAVSVWAVVNLADRRVVRADRVAELLPDSGVPGKDVMLDKLCLPEDMQPVQQRQMHYSDTDINAHVNNTRYADFICDALRVDLLEASDFVSGIQIDFLQECRPGESITLMTGGEDRAKFVAGVDETGKIRFRGQLFLGQDIP